MDEDSCEELGRPVMAHPGSQRIAFAPIGRGSDWRRGCPLARSPAAWLSALLLAAGTLLALAALWPLPPSSPPVAVDDVVRLATAPDKVVTMFCFSIVLPQGHEAALVQWQQKQKASIFGCEESAVFTNKSFALAAGGTTALRVLDRELGCRPESGVDWSFNAWLFIALWRDIIAHGKWQYHDWTVKVDSNAVFFPQRLSLLLQRHSDKALITDGPVGVHSPVEAISREALAVIAEDYAISWDGKAPKSCMEEAHISEYGNCTRDSFLDVCLMRVLLGDKRTVDESISCDRDYDNCPAALHCGDDRASFHPHDTVEDYSACVRNSMGVAG